MVPPFHQDRSSMPDLEILEVPVSPSRRKSLGSSILMALATIAIGTSIFGSVIGQDRRPDEMGCVYLIAASFAAALGIFLFAASRTNPSPGILRIEPDQVRWRSGVEIALSYGDLWVAHKAGRGRRERLVLKAQKKAPIVIQTSLLPDAQVADSVLETVHDRIRPLPDGPQRLEAMTARQAVADRVASGRKAVVFTVSILLGLVFLAELVTGALNDPFRLWAFGAGSFPLVKDGELFRLATANLLHGSVIHIFFNVMTLFSLGVLLEPLLGAGRFLTVFLVSALAGAAASSFLGHHVLALGASTGIAGLIAAYALVLWRWPDRLSNPPTRNTWLWIAFAFLLPALTFKNVDNMAHLGGFLAGFVMVFPETRKVELVELADRRQALFQVTAAVLVALFLVACGMAIRKTLEPERDLAVASILLRDPSPSPGMLNNLAWKVATSPAASEAQLTTALRGMERAIKSEPKDVAFRDTQATVLYRLGRWQEAVRTEYDLLAADRKPLYISHLARFEQAMIRSDVPLVLGQPPGVLISEQIAPDGSILLDISDPQQLSGAILHLVLSRQGKAVALLELMIGASETSESFRYALPGGFSGPRPDKVFVALVDARKVGGSPSRTYWKLQEIVPEAARLP